MPVQYDSKRGRWVSSIDRVIKKIDGTSERVRKQKVFPAGTTEAQAKILAEHHESGQFIKAHIIDNESGWRDYVKAMYLDTRSWLHISIQKARNRANSAGRDCTLTPESVRDLLFDCGGRCAVTGVRFDLSGVAESRKRPMFHSLDRIDSSKGYTQSNTRVVCYAANVAMMNWGESVFSDLATGYVLRKYALGKMLLLGE